MKLFLLLTISLSGSHSQCVYTVLSGYLSPLGNIIQTYVIQDFKGGCEFLCYRSQDCSGANVRRLDNGTVLCEFRSVAMDRFTRHLALSQYDAKYIVKKTAEDSYEHINRALSRTGAVCSAGSSLVSNPCENAIDGTLSTLWLSDRYDVDLDTWMEVNLTQIWFVYRVDIVSRCYEELYIKGVDLNFTDGTIRQFSGLRCVVASCTDGDILPVSVRTEAVRVILTERCLSFNTTKYLGLKEIRVFGFTDL